MIPDIVADNVTDCARRLGYQFTEQVFYRASLEAGFGQRAEDKARELDTLWKRQGYKALPAFCKDFILKACDGQYKHPITNVDRGAHVFPERR